MNLDAYIPEQIQWLYTKIYQNNIFFIDLWSLAHFFSGFIIYLLLRKFKAKRPFLYLTGLLLLYEIVEISFTYFAFHIFMPETIKDQFTDIFVGLFGALVFAFLIGFASKYRDRYEIYFTAIIALLASMTYAFLWVGFYGYKYDGNEWNSSGLNYSAFIFWTAGAFGTISFYRLIWWFKPIGRFMITWLAYLPVLFLVEYFGYHILQLHEISRPGSSALLLGLIHGTRTLHIFYLISPLITIPLFLLLKNLFYSCVDAILAKPAPHDSGQIKLESSKSY